MTIEVKSWADDDGATALADMQRMAELEAQQAGGDPREAREVERHQREAAAAQDTTQPEPQEE